MKEKLLRLQEELFNGDEIYSSQKKMQSVTGKRGNHLGAIKIGEKGEYKIYLPRYPLEVLKEPILDYIKTITGLDKNDDVTFALHAYGKLHEDMHFDNFLEEKYAIQSSDKNKKRKVNDYQEELTAETKTISHSKCTEGLGIIYTVATIVNAYEYLNDKQMAKDLAKMFPEIKEEAKFLKSYMRSQKRGLWN